MFKQKKAIFFSSISIIILSLLVFYPTFKLALFGDDWLAFWRYNHHLGPKSSGEFNHLTYYLTPYGAQDVIMGLLNKIYGFNSALYYLTSYILRMIAAFSLFPLVFYLTKNKLAAFFAVLFFSVTVVGLDATNWVFNMPTYITISLFFVSLYFFISSREQKTRGLIISAVLYYLAYITTPIRMHGSLPFIFLIEAFWVIQKRDIKTLKTASWRFIIMFLVFLVVKYTGHSLGPSNEISERFNLGITTALSLLGQGRFDFIFYPLVMTGSMIVPDLLLNGSSVITLKQFVLTFTPTFLISSLLIFSILKFISKFRPRIFLNISLAFIFWTFIVAIINRQNLISFNNSTSINLLLIGGYTFIITASLSFLYYKRSNIRTLLFFSHLWMVLSFFFAWWWVPNSIFPTTYRYLIVSATGVSILFATVINLGAEKKQQIYLCLLFSPILFFHIISNRIYINSSLSSHSQEASAKIWSSIPYIPDIKKNKDPFIFYFEGDDTNAAILHDVVTFGFPPHMAIIYHLNEGDPIPVPMSDFKELVSAVTDGKTMPAYGLKAEPVDVNRIYAFHLEGRNNLIEITNQARNKLKELKGNTQKK